MFFSRLFAEKAFLGLEKRKENNKQMLPKNHWLGSFTHFFIYGVMI
jgi:hypothetical protein